MRGEVEARSHDLIDRVEGVGDGFDALHAYIIDRLVPACASLLSAAAAAGELSTDLTAHELMRGIGSRCIGAEHA